MCGWPANGSSLGKGKAGLSKLQKAWLLYKKSPRDLGGWKGSRLLRYPGSLVVRLTSLLRTGVPLRMGVVLRDLLLALEGLRGVI